MKLQLDRLNERYIELYKDGYRASVIMETLSSEFHISVDSLYKRLNIRNLKKIAEQPSN